MTQYTHKSSYKLALYRAWNKHIIDGDYTDFVTFIFNMRDTTSKESARRLLEKFHRNIDHQLYGPGFHKKSRDQRTNFIAFMENADTNLHFHAALTTPKIDEFKRYAHEIWEELVPMGDLHIGEDGITDTTKGKAATYITKQLMSGNNVDNWFISYAKSYPEKKPVKEDK